MKTSIIFSDGVTQIVLTPENDNEKRALSYINPKNKMDLAVINDGRFGDGEKPFAKRIDMCQGGYLRTFADEHSRILVLKPIDESKLEPAVDHGFTIESLIDYIKETDQLIHETKSDAIREHLTVSQKISRAFLKLISP